MSYRRNHRPQGSGVAIYEDRWGPFNRNSFTNRNRAMNVNWSGNYNNNWSHNINANFSGKFGNNVGYDANFSNQGAPSFKRRKFSDGTWEDGWRYCPQPRIYEGVVQTTYNNPMPPQTRSNIEVSTSNSSKRGRSKFEDDEPVFMSRDEIEKCSPSRKDGIDALRETFLRYSYCAFIRDLGLRLELPQTTIGTAMVLCHRFFVRHSHASHDRFLISTAALFLAAKAEDTPCPLNNVLRTSAEMLHKHDIAFLSYLLPIDWFEQYRERVLEAEHLILTTLNFELHVQHPYAPLTSVLDKLGLSETMLVNLALSLVSEGLRSSLWLQFKPHHIAAGAAYLAAKFLNFDLSSYSYIWQEFQTTPAILEDVAQQLMELFY